MIECQQPQAHPARCGCEQETSAGLNVHASESGLPYAVRAASLASHRISPAIIASDPRLMKAESSAERTLRNLGYADNGGELWKPPIGEKPNFSLIDALRQQLADVSNERDGLRAFANELVNASYEGGCFDACELQEIAEKHNLVRLVRADEYCGEACACAQYGFPAECYRKNQILCGKPTEQKAQS